MDEYLLEAMREVDAMLPGTPPIAPGRSDGWLEIDCHPRDLPRHVVLTMEERWYASKAGISDRAMALLIVKEDPGRVAGK
jgi:hypothetical protein